MVFLSRQASSFRAYSTSSKFHRTSYLRRRVFLLSVVGGAGACYLHTEVVHADEDPNNSNGRYNPLRNASVSTLLRSYFVYSVCSWPAIVNHSPFIISTAIAVPGLKQLAEAAIRHTFFAQFVGGDTAEDTLHVLGQLRRNNIGALLAYSVEVDEDQAKKNKTPENNSLGYKKNVEETIRSIDVAADFEERSRLQSGGKTWVAIKLTALLPSADSLIRLSDYLIQTTLSTDPHSLLAGTPDRLDLQFLVTGMIPPGLTSDDMQVLKELYANLTRIAERAYERKVKIIIDAEYTWYQPAIDAFILSLMRRYNKRTTDKPDFPHQPLIYGTYQAYLKRTPWYLNKSLEDAKKYGYALGVKLVRGAYHHFEMDAASSLNICPVWSTKPETDSCFDSCADILIAALRTNLSGTTPSTLGILFGTHNARSCDKILKMLIQNNLAESVGGRLILNKRTADYCVIAQLYGMSDALTYSLVNTVQSDTPFIIKYIPYGPLSSVMPYLGRRAVENSSVLSADGGATSERNRVGAELYRRFLKGY